MESRDFYGCRRKVKTLTLELIRNWYLIINIIKPRFSNINTLGVYRLTGLDARVEG